MAGKSANEAARRMRAKAARLTLAAERYERGSTGEAVTAAVLRKLPPDRWTVFDDLPWPGRPRANVDHVVVGDAGVFVIDSKTWTGRIEVRGSLRQNGRKRTAAVDGVRHELGDRQRSSARSRVECAPGALFHR